MYQLLTDLCANFVSKISVLFDFIISSFFNNNFHGSDNVIFIFRTLFATASLELTTTLTMWTIGSIST